MVLKLHRNIFIHIKITTINPTMDNLHRHITHHHLGKIFSSKDLRSLQQVGTTHWGGSVPRHRFLSSTTYEVRNLLDDQF